MFFWATIEKSAPFLLTFIFSIILARLLPPEAYGLVAMVGILVALGNVVQGMGFGAALVQRDDIGPDEETSVFAANVVLGAVMAILLTLVAPAIASFYGRPELVEIVYANAALLVVMSLGLVQSAMLHREFKFKTGFVIDTAAAIVAGIVGICLALLGYGVWSLIALALSREATRTSLLWMLVRWRPIGHVSVAAIARLWPYSRRLLGASLYHHAATNLAGVIVGKYHSATTLGLFARAQSLQALPGSLLIGAVHRVVFPLYCRSQTDHGSLHALLRAHVRSVALLAGLITAGMMTSAKEIVLILVGEAWIASADMLRLLSAAIFLSSIFPLHSEMNKAIGESSYFFFVEVTKKTVLLSAIGLGAWFGTTGLLWALVAVSISDYVLSASASVKYLDYGWGQQLADLLPAAMTTVVAVAVAFLVHTMVSEAPVIVGLAAKGTVVLLVFALAVLGFGKRAFPEASSALREAVVPMLARWASPRF